MSLVAYKMVAYKKNSSVVVVTTSRAVRLDEVVCLVISTKVLPSSNCFFPKKTMKLLNYADKKENILLELGQYF